MIHTYESVMLSRIFCYTVCTVNVLKYGTLFSLCSSIKFWDIKAGIHKMFVGIANRKDPDQAV